MIGLGLDATEKQRCVADYVATQGITQVFVFAPAKFPLPLEGLPVPTEAIDYTEIIMYKVFYRLLEVIDQRTLLVFNECLRTQNRSDLTYNCAHHYANQTSHVLVFEHFPFIEKTDDCMILLDLQSPGKYKGRSFDPAFLLEENVQATRRTPALEIRMVPLPAGAEDAYTREKEKLFAALGPADPETIPRKLHLFAGRYKRAFLDPAERYIARNDRFNLPNVATYRDHPTEGIVIDFPHRRLDFNDFLKTSGMTTVRFLHSGLKVDDYYVGEFQRWIERMDAFYAQTSLLS